MSSKSRYQNQPRKPQNKVEHVDGGDADVPQLEDFEEIVHVPEGKSKVQFLFLIGLLIFLLVIFIIPTAFQSVATGGADTGGAPGVVWETPIGGKFELSDMELRRAMRDESDIRRVLMGGGNATPTEAEMATQLLQDQLAREAGIFVSDEALAKSLLEQIGEAFPSHEAYVAFTRSAFGSRGTVVFEEYIRKGIIRRRYLTLTGLAAAQPKPGDVEAAWAEGNQEYAFDYLAVKTPAFVEDAKAEAPSAEELEAWLVAQPDTTKNRFKTQAMWRLASAYIPIGEAAPAALLERYPLPETFDAAAEGEQFYNTHSYQAFKLEEPIVGEDGTEVRYQPLDEVRPLAEAAAAVKVAMAAWRDDVRARVEAGEAVDLQAEATALGITYAAQVEAKDRAAIVEDQMYGGGAVSSLLPTTEPGQIMSGVVVTPKVIELVEVLESVEPTLKPFVEIQDQVLDRWAEGRSKELAVEFAEALKGDAETLDMAAFTALADGERVELRAREWGTKPTFTGQLPEGFELFLMFSGEQAGLFELEEGGLSDAMPNGEEILVLRSRGERDRDFAEATPGEVQQAMQMATSKQLTNYIGAFMSEDRDELPAYLVETYGLRIPSTEESRAKAEEDRKKRDAEREAAEAGASE